MLGQKRHIENRFLVQQLVHFVLDRFLEGVQNARIEEHHFAIGQCNDAVPKSRNNFSISSGNGFDKILCETAIAFDFGVYGRSNPYKSIVAQNNRGSAWEIVKMGFATLNQRWEHFDEDSLGELEF